MHRLAVFIGDESWWKAVIHVMVELKRQSDLTKVVLASSSPRRSARRLNGWQQEPNQRERKQDRRYDFNSFSLRNRKANDSHDNDDGK